MAAVQIVRFKANKITFEVCCKVGTALKFQQGQLGFDNVLASDEIWKDSKKGDRASAAELLEAFATDNVKQVAQTIVEKGDIQLTDAERKEILEKKRNEIINYIHKCYTDPKTKTPHPVLRIDNALTELKIRIDPDVPTDRQIQDIVKRLPEVIAIKKSEIRGIVTVTHKYLAQVQGVFKKFGIKVEGEQFNSSGCDFDIAIVPGDYDKLLKELNDQTKGEFDFKIEDGSQADATPTNEKGGRGGKGRGGRGGRGKNK